MSERAMELLEQALQLSQVERATVADRLLSSLIPQEPEIDALWATEAEARIGAYEAGELNAIPAAEVFAQIQRS